MSAYRWKTDAASGTMLAPDPDTVLTRLIYEREWALIGGPLERADLADGAWLRVWDASGKVIYARGEMP